MEDENIIPDALPDAPAADANGTVVSEPSAGDAMTLADINQHLGKNFPNKETALKALKDTFSYVGKKKDDVLREVRAEVKNDDRLDQLAGELAEERKERFYLQNPQYASTRSLIEKMGKSPAEVVNSVEFKDIFTKISGFDESQKLKTVLESNPRLSSSRDSLAKAREIAKESGSVTAEVTQNVLNAVKDAYGM